MSETPPVKGTQESSRQYRRRRDVSSSNILPTAPGRKRKKKAPYTPAPWALVLMWWKFMCLCASTMFGPIDVMDVCNYRCDECLCACGWTMFMDVMDAYVVELCLCLWILWMLMCLCGPIFLQFLSKVFNLYSIYVCQERLLTLAASGRETPDGMACYIGQTRHSFCVLHNLVTRRVPVHFWKLASPGVFVKGNTHV